MFNLEPLYKILCISLVFFIPLVPAILLYFVAPRDRFLAVGNFNGFKINATGASAIYIVLCAAFYAKVNNIIKNIDVAPILQSRIDSLENARPWKVRYNVKLMSDATHEIDASQYGRIVDPDSVLCFPRAIRFDSDTKQLTFYVDNEIMQNIKDTLKGSLILRKGFGTATFAAHLNPEVCKNRIVNINEICIKQSSKTYPKISVIRRSSVPIISRENGLSAPPSLIR